jgi:hypothetical protein
MSDREAEEYVRKFARLAGHWVLPLGKLDTHQPRYNGPAIAGLGQTENSTAQFMQDSEQPEEGNVDGVSEYSDYTHGVVCIPVLITLRAHGVLEWIARHPGCSLDALANQFHANAGHLMVAIRALVSIGVLKYDSLDHVSYAAGAALGASVDSIPGSVMELYTLDMEHYLSSDLESPIACWIDLVARQWPGVQSPMIAAFLDGTLILPVILALARDGRVSEQGVCVRGLSDSVQCDLGALFKAKEWLQGSVDEYLQLTSEGLWVAQRVLSSGVAASYRPMLSKTECLIFGNPRDVFTRDAQGNEEHVDRTMNVIGSEFQHTRYFDAMAEQVLSIMRECTAEQRPRYIVDTGCGDGTLLCTLYTALCNAELASEGVPLIMVGVAYNKDSIAATEQNCNTHNIPLIAVRGAAFG